MASPRSRWSLPLSFGCAKREGLRPFAVVAGAFLSGVPVATDGHSPSRFAERNERGSDRRERGEAIRAPAGYVNRTSISRHNSSSRERSERARPRARSLRSRLETLSRLSQQGVSGR